MPECWACDAPMLDNDRLFCKRCVPTSLPDSLLEMEAEPSIEDAAYWRAVLGAWCVVGTQYNEREKWRTLLASNRRGAEECFFTPEMAGLPAVVTAYRGFCMRGGERGFSWTLSPAYAESYARTAGVKQTHRRRGIRADGKYVACARLHRSQIFAALPIRDSTHGRFEAVRNHFTAIFHYNVQAERAVRERVGDSYQVELVVRDPDSIKCRVYRLDSPKYSAAFMAAQR